MNNNIDDKIKELTKLAKEIIDSDPNLERIEMVADSIECCFNVDFADYTKSYQIKVES